MPAPFYNAIKGTTAGTPGTGAFTPNAASSGFLAWSTVPTGWIGLVRYEDGSAWELQYSYWNGTTLSRSATAQFVSSSTGSALTLTSAATAALVVDASDLQPDLGTTKTLLWTAIVNATGASVLGLAGILTGTSAAAALATTNYLTEQVRLQLTSATTASAQAGVNSSFPLAVVSTAAGRGGFEFVARFGASALPTGPRLFVGVSTTSPISATEPSAIQSASIAAFTKDSTDTNIQLLCNDGTATGGTKTDTGIPLAANGWYEAAVWCEPGSNKVYGLLIRIDTGAIWFGSTTTDVPANGALPSAYVVGGLNATNTGTAIVMHLGGFIVRVGQ